MQVTLVSRSGLKIEFVTLFAYSPISLKSIYLIILSLKQVVLLFVVVAHGRLLLPRFLELTLVVHNFVSLRLHFCVLHLHKQVQVFSVELLSMRLVRLLLLLPMFNLSNEVVVHGVRHPAIFIGHVLDHVVGLFRPEVILLV